MLNFLRKAWESIELQFAATYLVLVALFGGGYLYNSHQQWERLAGSYARAARHSFLLHDYRQAVSSVSPALADGFTTITIEDKNNGIVIGLPNDSAASEVHGPFTTSVDVRIKSDGTKVDGPEIVKLKFSYSTLSSIFFLFISAVALFCALLVYFRKIKKREVERQAFEFKKKQLEFERDLARQVAHDIRSPVAALEVLVKDSQNFPGEQNSLVQGAIYRICEIANDLLKKNDGAISVNTRSSQPVSSLVMAIVNEKRTLFSEKTGITIEFINPEPEVIAEVSQVEFMRALSNLINNAVESMEQGRISVSLLTDSDNVVVEVRDDGKGIPAHVLESLGQRGMTFGKTESESGSGLGLAHAKNSVESWGGSLKIESTVGLGTSVKLIFPKGSSPQRLANEQHSKFYDLVLVDDDKLVRQIWEISAIKRNKRLLCISSHNQLLLKLHEIDVQASIFLDSQLGDAGMRGEEIAKDLFDRGYKNLYLCTGYRAENFRKLPFIKGVVGKEPPWL